MDTGVLLRTFSLSLILAGFYSCNFKRSSPEENSIASVDSLIQDQWINEKTLLVSFGAEAVTAIRTEKGIVVIDAGISTGLTRKYRRKIEQKFPNSQFACIIITHAHHDHFRGNNVFPEAQVLGHENGPAEMEEYWKDPDKVEKSLKTTVEEYEVKLVDCQPHSEDWHHNFTQKLRYQNASQDAKKKLPIRKPELLFSDSLTIKMGDVNFELKYFGRCHSNSDILIYIPELHILFTGDLMLQYGRPSIREKFLAEKDIWHSAVAWTEKRMPYIETVIGGHGQVFAKDELKSFNRNILEK